MAVCCPILIKSTPQGVVADSVRSAAMVGNCITSMNLWVARGVCRKWGPAVAQTQPPTSAPTQNTSNSTNITETEAARAAPSDSANATGTASFFRQGTTSMLDTTSMDDVSSYLFREDQTLGKMDATAFQQFEHEQTLGEVDATAEVTCQQPGSGSHCRQS